MHICITLKNEFIFAKVTSVVPKYIVNIETYEDDYPGPNSGVCSRQFDRMPYQESLSPFSVYVKKAQQYSPYSHNSGCPCQRLYPCQRPIITQFIHVNTNGYVTLPLNITYYIIYQYSD